MNNHCSQLNTKQLHIHVINRFIHLRSNSYYEYLLTLSLEMELARFFVLWSFVTVSDSIFVKNQTVNLLIFPSLVQSNGAIPVNDWMDEKCYFVSIAYYIPLNQNNINLMRRRNNEVITNGENCFVLTMLASRGNSCELNFYLKNVTMTSVMD